MNGRSVQNQAEYTGDRRIIQLQELLHFFSPSNKRANHRYSEFTNPRMTVIRATDICEGRTVVDLPSLLNSASSWFKVTNSASIATKSPWPGISSAASGRNEIRCKSSDFWANDLSSLKTSAVIGLAVMSSPASTNPVFCCWKSLPPKARAKLYTLAIITSQVYNYRIEQNARKLPVRKERYGFLCTNWVDGKVIEQVPLLRWGEIGRL